jgi:hypothetical protein
MPSLRYVSATFAPASPLRIRVTCSSPNFDFFLQSSLAAKLYFRPARINEDASSLLVHTNRTGGPGNESQQIVFLPARLAL